MLESMGLHTGVDLDGLLAARAILAEGLPNEPRHGGAGSRRHPAHLPGRHQVAA